MFDSRPPVRQCGRRDNPQGITSRPCDPAHPPHRNRWRTIPWARRPSGSATSAASSSWMTTHRRASCSMNTPSSRTARWRSKPLSKRPGRSRTRACRWLSSTSTSPATSSPAWWLWRPTCSTSWPPTSPWRNCWPPPGPPARPRSAAAPAAREDRVNYGTLEHAGKPHKGKTTDAEKQLVQAHLDEINERLAAQNLRTISLTDPDHIERYGLEELAGAQSTDHPGQTSFAEEQASNAA